MLYHKDIGFPTTLKIPVSAIYNVTYTKHALSRKKRENQNKVNNLPKHVKIKMDQIIEIESMNNVRVTKMVLKIPFNRTQDIIMVLSPPNARRNYAKVITFWLNQKEDHHPTLKKVYDKP